MAVWKQARVPPATARRPSRARSALRSGAMPPMPPIWMAIEEKFEKPAQSVGGDHRRALGELAAVHQPLQLDVAQELVGRRLDAEQAAHGHRLAPRHAHDEGERREQPAEQDAQAELDVEEATEGAEDGAVEQSDEAEKGEQHGADV